MIKPTKIKEINFSPEEVEARFNKFVQEFLSGEEFVMRKKVLPHFWLVKVPDKDFNATIKLESHSSVYEFDEWTVIVYGPNGEKSNFSLFKEESEEWLAKHRKISGFE